MHASTVGGTGRGEEGAAAGSDAPEALARAWFDRLRARADRFAHERFGVRGALALHRAALGPDLLRAPVNVLLAPVHVALALASLGAGAVGLRGIARWLRERDVFLKTDTGRAVEALLARDLLGLSPPRNAEAAGDPLAASLLDAPALAPIVLGLPDEAARAALGRRLARAVRDYAGTRGAVAEASVALATLGIGALAFGALTPGMLSMAPSVANAIGLEAAVSGFWAGERLGSLWYGAFPPDVPPGLLAATVAALVATGATLAAFAGVVADPVQVRLGIHRRRLHRLLDALEAESVGARGGGFRADEHYYARLFDLVDAGASVLRVFRG